MAAAIRRLDWTLRVTESSIGSVLALLGGELLVASAFLDWLAFWTRRKHRGAHPDRVVAGRATTSRVRGIDDAHETTKSSVVLNP